MDPVIDTREKQVREGRRKVVNCETTTIVRKPNYFAELGGPNGGAKVTLPPCDSESQDSESDAAGAAVRAKVRAEVGGQVRVGVRKR